MRRAAAVGLAAELPWELGFDGGVYRLRVDVTAGMLRSLAIGGGVSQAQPYLPAPDGIVPGPIGPRPAPKS